MINNFHTFQYKSLFPSINVYWQIAINNAQKEKFEFRITQSRAPIISYAFNI